MTDKSARAVITQALFDYGGGGGADHDLVDLFESVCHDQTQAILAALEAGGFAVVPVKPTPKMIEAAQYATFAEYERHPLWEEAKDVIENIDESAIWSAMLAASNPKEEGR